MKRKFTVIVWAVILLLSVHGAAFAVVYGRGGYESEGYSESTAWEIDSAEVLAKLRDDVNAGKLQYAFYVKLTKDIDLTGQIYRAWEPIGRNPFAADLNFNPNDERGVFRGHFDGNGHTIKVEISKLCAKSSYQDIVPIFHGLFGIIMGGSIKNLNVSGNIEVFMRESSTPVLVGGIASYLASGSIENCRFNGNIKAENLVGSFRSDGGTQAGGIVARAGYSFYIFSIKNCRVGSCSDTVITASDAIETGNTYAGGIAAYLDDNTYQSKSSTVSGNYIRAEINGRYLGGIYAARGRGTGLVYDNTEDDPSEPPPDTASITITTDSLPSGNIGENYSETLTASMTGGTWPVTWSITSGTLPAGLTLNDDGTISGSPTAKGTFNFTVMAAIGSGGSITATKQYTVTIADNQPSYALTVKNASLSGGSVGTSYSETLKAELTGAELPATWSYTGTLPPGLTLNTNGTITGTPTATGTYTFTVTAVFGAFTGSKSFTVVIAQAHNPVVAPSITTTSLPNGIRGASYSQPLSATGTAPITWTQTSGVLPPGLTLSKAGKISGTPTKAGTYKFAVKATNSAGNVSKEFTITITQTAISGKFAETGIVKVKYTSTVTASGGTANYTWKNSGTLPTGLKLTYSGNKATLSGTPTKAGTFTFKLTATDKNGVAVTKSFTVKITQPTISGTFANGVVKAKYTGSVTVSGGTSPYTWKNTGTLPTGTKITYSGAKATLSGTPTKAGTYTFTLTATDKNKVAASKKFTVKITQTAISETFANGVVKAKYSSTVTASGGTAPYTWKNTGTLPTGTKITYSGAKATLSGTPTKAGTYTFTLTATDKNKVAASKKFTVKITQTTISETFANGVVKAKYSSTVTASGGTAPYTWKNTGTLPTGTKITYSGAKATLSGTPTKAGTYTFTLTATDKNKVAASKKFTVKITQPAISGTFANGVVKAAYNSSVTVSGGTVPYTWKNTGTLPTGTKITYSGAKATLSGTPTKAGTYTFTLTATDKNKVAASKKFTVKITQPAISGTFANGVVKAAYNSSVTVSGGTAPYTWKNTGTLPTGTKITYSGAKATLSGTPTKAGTYTFTLTATDKNKVAASKKFTVKITQPAISGTFANGVVKAAYNSSVTVSGGIANYTWKKVSGTIPSGLKLTFSDAKATLSGTPTKAGTYTFKLTATDKNKASVSKSFTVKITEAKSSSNKVLTENSADSQTANTLEGQALDRKSSLPETQNILPDLTPGLSGNGTNTVNLCAELRVVSDDIVEVYEGKDSDLVKVLENKPLRFTVSNWGEEVSDITVYINDKAENSVAVSEEGTFTLPAELVSGDFKVGVKAQSEARELELESEEIYIIAE